jgi:uncharacterized integral membrane protein (TIGR00698 family)
MGMSFSGVAAMSIQATILPPSAAHAHAAKPASILPGLFLTVGIAALAVLLHQLPVVGTFSPMILAILIGIAFHNLVGTPRVAKPGVTFSLRRLLRAAIVLLGLQLTLTQVRDVGGVGILIIAVTLVSTFVFTTSLGRLLGVEAKLSRLIAAGTSICGASAVIAANTAVDGKDEDVAYAIACVTVFGSIAMFAYPLAPALLGLDARAYGLWTGASIHEIAQVVAAAFQNGKESGDFGTIAKLTRVMMLAPMVLALGFLRSRSGHGKGAKAPMPWFVLGFIAVICFNSLVHLPPAITAHAATVTTFMLSTALAAMGLETDLAKLKAKGLAPLALGAAASLFIAGFSLVLIRLTAT